MTKSSLRFKTLPPELSSYLLSATTDDPQIYPSRSADVEETEGMYTPTEERGDLAIRNLWKYQTDCILDVRITNLDAPSDIRHSSEKPSFFPMNVKRRNTSKSAWINAATLSQ